MTDSNDIAAPTPTVNTPRRVKWVAGIGIPVSLIAAAAVSFAGLTELGGYAGIQHPWLMPVAIDVYATTSTLIAMLLPEDHRARGTAVWHARLGLAMSMGGNATARALHLGASGSVATFSGALLTFVGAWPSLIVERLLQLQGRLAVGDTTANGNANRRSVNATANSAMLDRQQRTANSDAERQLAVPEATANKTARTANKTAKNAANTVAAGAKSTESATANSGANTRRSDPEWIEIAKPVYVAERDRLGKRPPEGAFHTALLAQLDRLTAEGLIAAADPPSPGTSKRVRGLVEAAFPELAALIHPVAS